VQIENDDYDLENGRTIEEHGFLIKPQLAK
jgi:hypothetical protein